MRSTTVTESKCRGRLLPLLLLVGCGHSPGTVDASAASRFTHHLTLGSQLPFLGEHFGAAAVMSGDGNTLAIADAGSMGPTGGVFVLARAGNAFEQQAYLQPADLRPGDLFGTSMQLSTLGDTLVIGAQGDSSAASGIDGNHDDQSLPGAGAAYVFKRNGTIWIRQTYLKASNPDAFDRFGAVAAISGDGNTIAIGAPFEDSPATGIDGDQVSNAAVDAGAVYVFATDGTTWAQQAYLKASNTDAGDGFGTAVALAADGATLAAGAPHEASATAANPADNSRTDAGAAYVFVRAAAWTQVAVLKTATPTTGDTFGGALAISGLATTLVVGAAAESLTGVAHVFHLAGTWSDTAQLRPPPPAPSQLFGARVALSADGETLAVQAPTESSTAAESGAVYAFANLAGSWHQTALLKAPLPVLDQRFGNGLALSNNGSLLLAGDVGDDAATTDAGAAYLFY